MTDVNGRLTDPGLSPCVRLRDLGNVNGGALEWAVHGAEMPGQGTREGNMHTETEPGDTARDVVHPQTEPADREERRVEAILRAFRHLIEGEPQADLTTLRKIDHALRGDTADD